GGRQGSAAIPAGVAEVTYTLDQDCNSAVTAVKDISPGGARGRPKPPQLPDGFTPFVATLIAQLPARRPGTAANVAWARSFWTTAPVITAGICDIDDSVTKEAAEIAVRRWQESPNLGWQIKRDDSVCDDDVPGPKMLIVRETVDTEDILGREWEDELDTPG